MNLTMASVLVFAGTNGAFLGATSDDGVVTRLNFFFFCALILATLGFCAQIASAVSDAKKRREKNASRGLKFRQSRRCGDFRKILARTGFFWAIVLGAIFAAANLPRPSENDSAVPTASLSLNIGAENGGEISNSQAEWRAVGLNDEETPVWRGATSTNAVRSNGNARSVGGTETRQNVGNVGETGTRRPIRSVVAINGPNAAGNDAAQNGKTRTNDGVSKIGLPTETPVYIPNVNAKVVEERSANEAANSAFAQVSANRGKIAQPIYREDPRNGAARSKIAQTCFEPTAPLVPYPIDSDRKSAAEFSGSLTRGGNFADVESTQGMSILEQIDAEFNRISDRVKTSVLPIETRKKTKNASQKVERETGTGFLTQYLDRIFLITNRHVVADAESREAVKVFLPNQKTISPTKIMTCVDFDLAVLELNPAELPQDGSVSLCFFGDSDSLQAMNFVGTVGNPFGLENTVTYGRVGSPRRRSLPLNKTQKNSLQEYIQIDASINPGNSGGPLYNARGEVVGVVTAIATTSGKNEGVAFAIPINLALEVVKATIDAGGWRRSRLGVELAPATRDDVEAANLPGVFGAKVVKVEQRSPAEKAGVRAGDVVLTFDGETVEDDAHLARLIAIRNAERGATLQILRGARVFELKTGFKRGESKE